MYTLRFLSCFLGHEVTQDIPYDVTIDAAWVKDWNPDSHNSNGACKLNANEHGAKNGVTVS